MADRARRDADAVLEIIPEELRSAPEHSDHGSGSQAGPSRWIADPVGLRRICEAAVQRLIAMPAGVPSLRLLADQTAEVLGGISRALNGLALLVDDPARPVPWGSRVRLRVPDWLPSLVNAGRAFVVIGAAELFWIVTEWPNGAQAITFAAIGVICSRREPTKPMRLPRVSWWVPPSASLRQRMFLRQRTKKRSIPT